MNGRYVLDGHTAIPCDDLFEWARRMEGMDRKVADTRYKEGVRVSTVFLGLDHQFVDGGVPLIFETMVFGGEFDGEQERCSTWEQAEAQHQAMIDRIYPTLSSVVIRISAEEKP